MRARQGREAATAIRSSLFPVSVVCLVYMCPHSRATHARVYARPSHPHAQRDFRATHRGPGAAEARARCLRTTRSATPRGALHALPSLASGCVRAPPAIPATYLRAHTHTRKTSTPNTHTEPHDTAAAAAAAAAATPMILRAVQCRRTRAAHRTASRRQETVSRPSGAPRAMRRAAPPAARSVAAGQLSPPPWAPRCRCRSRSCAAARPSTPRSSP